MQPELTVSHNVVYSACPYIARRHVYCVNLRLEAGDELNEFRDVMCYDLLRCDTL